MSEGSGALPVGADVIAPQRVDRDEYEVGSCPCTDLGFGGSTAGRHQAGQHASCEERAESATRVAGVSGARSFPGRGFVLESGLARARAGRSAVGAAPPTVVRPRRGRDRGHHEGPREPARCEENPSDRGSLGEGLRVLGVGVASSKAGKDGKAGKTRRKSSTRKKTTARGGAKARPRKGKAGGGLRGSLRSAFEAFPLGRVLRVLAVFAFICGFAAATWVASLDQIVRDRFSGRRFAVPSRVLSAPTILYPGLDAERVKLRPTLERLGYREVNGARRPLAVGEMRWDEERNPPRLRVHLRAFEHPTRAEPARDVALEFEAGPGSSRIIARILEKTGDAAPREVGAALLEPEAVGAFYGDAREQRELVRIGSVPRHLVDAIVAVEDRRFEEHHGIDPRRIAGAALANLRAGGVRQGGSTLTQQLVKNFFLTPERTYKRKATEAVMALIVEARFDKPEILQAYLNEIYLGQRGATAVHGVGEASRLFFGKPVAQLTLAESATIAAAIQSPNRLSPHRNPEDATGRRNLVLKLMLDQGVVDDEAYQQAIHEPLRTASVAGDPHDARYFLDLVRRQLPEVYDAELLAADGLRVYSTLDRRLQAAAAGALRAGIERIEKRAPPPEGQRLEGCLIALRPQTGEVLAMVGGRDYRRSQFDRCTQARRQVGSVFKPFVYAAALEARGGSEPTITLASVLEDEPYEVKTRKGPWKPHNFDRKFRGSVTVRQAIEQSLNVPAARLAQQVGIPRVIDLAERLGLQSKLPPVPSLALGTAELRPLEVARAYATLANGGTRPWPHVFEDVVSSVGVPLERRSLRFERVLDEGTAFLTTSLLEGVTLRGTAARVRKLGMTGALAAKTGTTDDEHDLWFVGYTPELVAVVWLGYDKPRSTGVTSTTGALPVWVDFMKEAVGTKVRGSFLPPPGLQRVAVHPVSGARALSGCPERRDEYFLPGTQPSGVCPDDALSPGDRNRLLQWFRSAL